MQLHTQCCNMTLFMLMFFYVMQHVVYVLSLDLPIRRAEFLEEVQYIKAWIQATKQISMTITK